MISLDHNTLFRMLVRSYRAKVAPFIWGTMGIGKSDVFKQLAHYLAKKEGRELIIWNSLTRDEKVACMDKSDKIFVFADTRLSQYDSSDLKGVPNMFGENAYVDWRQTILFNLLGKSDIRGALIFDEMNLALPSVMASAYQIVNDRQISEYPINKKVMIAAAGNRAKDRASVFNMPAPLRNRLIHAELTKPSIDTWIDWAIANNIDSRVIGFLRYKPSALFTFEEQPDAEAFATPRTWHKTSDLIKQIKGTTDDDLYDLEIMVGMAVGEGLGVEFRTFVQVQNDMDIQYLLKHPKEAGEIQEIDKRWALITGISELYKRSKKKDFEIEEAFQIVANFDPVFGLTMLAMMKKAKGPQNLISRASTSPAFNNFVKDHSIVLNAVSNVRK